MSKYNIRMINSDAITIHGRLGITDGRALELQEEVQKKTRLRIDDIKRVGGKTVLIEICGEVAKDDNELALLLFSTGASTVYYSDKPEDRPYNVGMLAEAVSRVEERK